MVIDVIMCFMHYYVIYYITGTRNFFLLYHKREHITLHSSEKQVSGNGEAIIITKKWLYDGKDADKNMSY